MTELTAASPQDVQLDNAKGVYTMHIDSRNLDSNSLLGKALDQIDADNDGKIEQHELDAFIKKTISDQVAIKNLKRGLIGMGLVLIGTLCVVFAMGFAAIKASKESNVYNDGETNTIGGKMVQTEAPSAAFNLVDLPILDDDLLADMVNLENIEYGGDTYTYKIAGYVRHGTGETNVTVYTQNNEKLLFSNDGNITVVDSAGVTHVVEADADTGVRRRLETLGLDINSHDSEHWKTLAIHASVEEGDAPRSLLTRRLEETGNMHGRSLKYKSKYKSYKYKSYKYKTKSKFKVKKSFKSYKKLFKGKYKGSYGSSNYAYCNSNMEYCDDENIYISSCFPAAARVNVQRASGAVERVSMRALKLGDMVQATAQPTVTFSPVFAFSHKASDVAVGTFVEIKLTVDGIPTPGDTALVLTEGHYVYANGALVAAGKVQVGDTVVTEAGATAVVAAVTRDVKGKGLYNPNTVHGDIVVEGVVVSTYTTSLSPAVAHALLWPLRTAWKTTGVDTSPVLEALARWVYPKTAGAQ